jgi:hypothetical protein
MVVGLLALLPLFQCDMILGNCLDPSKYVHEQAVILFTDMKHIIRLYG